MEPNLSNYGGISERKLRTLIYFDKDVDDKFDQDYVSVRVLVVKQDILNYSIHFGISKHLRYLVIEDKLKANIESITMLYNLQMLRLGVGIPLPKNLRKVFKLRYLQFDYIEAMFTSLKI